MQINLKLVLNSTLLKEYSTTVLNDLHKKLA